jgi:endonuclease YncB( thermonuclease family)
VIARRRSGLTPVRVGGLLAWFLWGLPTLNAGGAGDGLPMVCRVESIYDGDTMTVTCNREQYRVRLHCIDAPEMSQEPWGRVSRDYLRRITPVTVVLLPKATPRGYLDRYGRIVADVITPDDRRRNLGLQMVRTGHAAVYGKYCDEEPYFWMEQVARSAGPGRAGYSNAYDTAERALRWRSRSPQ